VKKQEMKRKRNKEQKRIFYPKVFQKIRERVPLLCLYLSSSESSLKARNHQQERKQKNSTSSHIEYEDCVGAFREETPGTEETWVGCERAEGFCVSVPSRESKPSFLSLVLLVFFLVEPTETLSSCSPRTSG